MIVEETVGRFFADYFKNNYRFKKPPYDHVYPKINIDSYDNTIRLSYIYDADRDGEAWATYRFNEFKFEHGYDLNEDCYILPRIDYESIPDEIWAIIQEKLYENAKETVEKELKYAKAAILNCEKKSKEFGSLKINE